MTQDYKRRQLKDYQVVGAGGARRAELLKSQPPIILQVYPQLIAPETRGIYQAALAQTQEWLKPVEIVEVQVAGDLGDFVLELLTQEFQSLFPVTDRLLGESSLSLLRDYLSEFPWRGPLASAHFRYLSVFLKRRGVSPEVVLTAQVEWLRAYLSFADFGSVVVASGLVALSPSLQSVSIHRDLESLGMERGLYIYYYDAMSGTVNEQRVDILEAALLDLLQEERKYTFEQLLEQARLIEPKLDFSEEEIRKRIHFLISRGIILSGVVDEGMNLNG